MKNDLKGPQERAPAWEEEPEEFLKNLATDPVWVNAEREGKELQKKFGLPEEPKLNDFPNHAAWSVAWNTYRDNFEKVTGYGDRAEEISNLYWSGDFDAGLGTQRDFLRTANRLNYNYGKCSLDEVIAEWRSQNAN